MKRNFLTILAPVLFCLVSCTEKLPVTDSGTRGNYTVRFDTSASKAIDPDENILHDINLFVFNEYGVLEEKIYVENYTEAVTSGGIRLTLVRNCTYDVYACANTGYAVNAATVVELMSARHYIAYPDDYRNGLPMSGTCRFTAGKDDIVDVPLVRLFAKVTICMDRSRLDDDVEMNVRSIRLGNCPKYSTIFSRNAIADTDGFFPAGFIRTESEVDILNTMDFDGKSGEVTLYILENMQGELLPGNTSESMKYFPDGDARSDYCSFAELSIEYLSPAAYSVPGEYLIYRFYIGTSPADFDVCRNTDYRVTISPSGDGLGEDGWRIEHDGMAGRVESISLNYSSLRMNYEGESVRISAYTEPENIGEDMLFWSSSDEDVASVSADGTVTAVGEGECIITCSSSDGTVWDECEVSVKMSPYYMKVYPGNFIRCKRGDDITVSCDYFPPDTEFDIGMEELEYDKARGIYDYTLGSDGRSVTLHTKAKGSGLLYMETGYPVNTAEMIVIVVD